MLNIRQPVQLIINLFSWGEGCDDYSFSARFPLYVLQIGLVNGVNDSETEVEVYRLPSVSAFG